MSKVDMTCDTMGTLMTYCLCMAELTEIAREEDLQKQMKALMTQFEADGFDEMEAIAYKKRFTKMVVSRSTGPQITALIKHLALVCTCSGPREAEAKFMSLGEQLATSKFRGCIKKIMDTLDFEELYNTRRLDQRLTWSLTDNTKKRRNNRSPTGYSDLNGRSKSEDSTRVTGVCDADTAKIFCTR